MGFVVAHSQTSKYELRYNGQSWNICFTRSGDFIESVKRERDLPEVWAKYQTL